MEPKEIDKGGNMSHEKPPDFLAHKDGDSVAVAVKDLVPGSVEGRYLEGAGSVGLELQATVPLGHKLALTDLKAGDDVIEYGLRVGIASKDIKRGEYVHVHNVRSARWQKSVA
jgi:(2R)-sulfolactate sulfo-lyase subunit alpha